MRLVGLVGRVNREETVGEGKRETERVRDTTSEKESEQATAVVI